MKNNYLPPLIAKANVAAQKIKDHFGALTYEQLNWKPSPQQWSVGQNVDHLIVSNRQYFEIFERVQQGVYNQSVWERLPFLPGLTGRMILKAILPDNEKKTKTFPVFEPAQSEVPADVVQQFLQNHEKLITHIQGLDHLEHRGIVVTSPVSKFVTYPLEYACTIVLEHEERHFRQAQRVFQHKSFPSATAAA
ncbi:MAG: DinB family protein [Bacteroidota bacterium]